MTDGDGSAAGAGALWLAAAAEALGASAGVNMSLSREDIAELLDLSRHAAHESGARLNAPLVTYLVGRASAGGDASVSELAALVRSATEPALARDES